MSIAVYLNRLLGRTIRVLELLPGNQEDDIQCNLMEKSLDDENGPAYEAHLVQWARNASDHKPGASTSETSLCSSSLWIIVGG